jgi:hypothetical protein
VLIDVTTTAVEAEFPVTITAALMAAIEMISHEYSHEDIEGGSQDALRASGADAVYYGTEMRGVSNAKAKRELHFQPRPLEWIVYIAVADRS